MALCFVISWSVYFFVCFLSAYTVLKFMIVWTLVLLADFILEFRLEYLWPCWLFFGSVYTTFHCHGLVRRAVTSCQDLQITACIGTNVTRLKQSFLWWSTIDKHICNLYCLPKWSKFDKQTIIGFVLVHFIVKPQCCTLAFRQRCTENAFLFVCFFFFRLYVWYLCVQLSPLISSA